MTDLSKDISRRVNIPLDNRITMRNKDKIVVTLHKDGYIGFRSHKCRHEYQISLASCYQMAIKQEKIEEWKVKEQQARLAGRRRPRKLQRSLLLGR